MYSLSLVVVQHKNTQFNRIREVSINFAPQKVYPSLQENFQGIFPFRYSDLLWWRHIGATGLSLQYKGHWTWESRSREAGRFSLLIYGFEQLRDKHTSPFSNRVSFLAERYNLLDVNLRANQLILARGARPSEGSHSGVVFVSQARLTDKCSFWNNHLLSFRFRLNK